MYPDQEELSFAFQYTNYKGKTRQRTVQPVSVIYDPDNQFHGAGYIMKAVDLETNEIRDFDLKQMLQDAFDAGVKSTRMSRGERGVRGYTGSCDIELQEMVFRA